MTTLGKKLKPRSDSTAVKHPGFDADVRRLYADHELSTIKTRGKAINNLAKKYGVSCETVRRYAQVYGFGYHRPWTQEEENRLRELIGKHPLGKISKIMHRSYPSICYHRNRLRLDATIKDGYSRMQVRELLGVKTSRVQEWIEKGWLRVSQENRISDEDLVAFLKLRPHEYSLRRVDEMWYKGMVFPGALGFEGKRWTYNESQS